DPLIRLLPGSTKAREQIVEMSQEYLEGLTAEARGDRELAFEAATAYLQLALIQGVPANSNLGRNDDAEASLHKADTLLQGVLKASPKNTKALLTAAEVEHDLMILAGTAHRRDETLKQAARAAASIEAFLSQSPVSPADDAQAARILSNIALAHKN